MNSLIFKSFILFIGYAFVSPSSTHECFLMPDSYLKVHGHTNIKGFSCDYEGFSSRDSIALYAIKNGRKISFNQCALKVNTCHFDCGNGRMNKDFEKLLEADQFPILTLKVQEAFIRSNQAADIKAAITIRDQTKIHEFPICYQDKDGLLMMEGIIPIKLTDYEIDPPTKMLGIVKVKDQIEVDFNIQLSVYSINESMMLNSE